MSYIKSYKLFENKETIWDVYEIFLDLFDKFKFKKSQEYLKQVILTSNYGKLSITETYLYGANCLKISLGATNQEGIIKKGNHKGFNSIINSEFKEMLMECNDRIIDLLNPVEVSIGSIGVYNMYFELVYFYEKPIIYEGVNLYGSNLVVELEKYSLTLVCSSKNFNMIKVLGNNNNILSIMSFMSYYDNNWYYIEPDDLVRFEGSDYIRRQWGYICKTLDINIDINQVTIEKDIKNPKISMGEFMSKLKKNQYDKRKRK